MNQKLFLETDFGKLFYHNIYALYGEPVVFTVLNEQGKIFFCYSLGLDDKQQCELWLITPITKDNLHRLEQKEMSVVDAIKDNNDEKFKLIKLDIENGSKEEGWILIQDSNYLMPNQDVYITEII